MNGKKNKSMFYMMILFMNKFKQKILYIMINICKMRINGENGKQTKIEKQPELEKKEMKLMIKLQLKDKDSLNRNKKNYKINNWKLKNLPQRFKN